MSEEHGGVAVLEPAPASQPQAPHVRVLAERCAGCEECVIRCPTAALSIDPEGWIAQAEDSLCVGCRQCERTCPFGAIRVEGPQLVDPRQPIVHYRPLELEGDTSEVHRGLAGWRQAVVEAERCLLCPDPTCMEGCPAHNDIPGFIERLRDRDVEGAQAVLSRTSVLSDICSRVCDTALQCEGACSWALGGGEPVAIGLLERFATDQRSLAGVQRRGSRGEGLSVCVVGSGPAGIAAAWELLAQGARVRMLDADAEPGGVLRWGIPAFTLPDAVLERPIEALLGAGLELEQGCELGRDVLMHELLERHSAVILAHGARQPLIPPVEGSDLEGVEDATTFLTRAKDALRRGELLPKVGSGRHVLVIGGGNTAMDVARTVRRLGGEATCVEWMNERFARVRPDELREARREGVRINFTTTVERLEGDGSVRAAHLRRTRHRRVDEQPRPLHGPARRMPVDHVVFALGYRVGTLSGTDAITLPLQVTSRHDALLDRRWIASGIMAGRPLPEGERDGPRSRVGWLALERELGLAVAGSQVTTGWWTRLKGRHGRRNGAGRARSVWRWRQRAAAGLAAAPKPRAERVWVAGDALVGPSTVAGAMAQGKAAAEAVLETCSGKP
jgi:glutamate synthase (NADPH/NADH) small chain